MEMQSPESTIKQIEAALERDIRINTHVSRISVTVENAQIILAGEVPDIASKRAAIDAAIRALDGSRTVTDRLRVRTDNPRQDLDLKQHAARALLNEPVFNEYTLRARAVEQTETLRDRRTEDKVILIGVQDGSITLSGVVESLTHGRLAEVLMWWTEGCQYVDNQLQVQPPEQDNDYEITDAIRTVLEKDPLVHAGQLSVGTAGGVVVLHGSIATREEKQVAIKDVWSVPGVSDVVDRIETRD